jgi:hypothetical protein
MDPDAASVSLSVLPEDQIHLQQQPWFPKVVADESSSTFQALTAQGVNQLPDSHVLFPVQLTSTDNHQLLWRDLFAMYSVSAMFGWDDKRLVVMPVPPSTAEKNDPWWWSVMGVESIW